MAESSSRRRKGGLIMTNLVMSIYRSAKPSSSSLKDNGGVGTFVMKREIATAPAANQKVAFPGGGLNKSTADATASSQQYRRKFDSIYGVPGDEKVDLKAATYISAVQERFRRDSLNSSTTSGMLP